VAAWTTHLFAGGWHRRHSPRGMAQHHRHRAASASIIPVIAKGPDNPPMALLPPVPLSTLADEATAALQAAFGGRPVATAMAPGRVNLIGEHIDYCDGFVLPFAIDRYVVMTACLNGLEAIRVGSGSDKPVTIPLSQPLEPGEPAWTNYIRGVVRGFQDRGVAVPGFDAWVVSSVPMGAGLSSSAALECCTATLLEALTGADLPVREKPLLCQQAEHAFAGVPCGIMDQYASTFGEKDRLVFIDCKTNEHSLVPFSDPDLTLIVANTNVHHELSDGGYASRRRATETGLAILGKPSWREVTSADIEARWNALGDPINRRCRHVVTEISRTLAAAMALRENAIDELGPLMAASHDSLRDDFEVSCKELDTMVEIATEIGGAGGGDWGPDDRRWVRWLDRHALPECPRPHNRGDAP
jgi:galactokinase